MSKKLIENSSSKDDCFFLITNYSLNNNEIIFVNITFIEKLDEERLFQSYYRHIGKVSLFKVIDVDNSYYICVDNFKNLYRIEKNKELETLKIKICQILMVNYELKQKSKSFLNDIKLDKKSIIKVSKQEIFFGNLIAINDISVIYIKFLDYKINNLYDTIIIDEKEIKINQDEIYYILSITNSDFDYFPINIYLLNSNNPNSKKKFKFILYKGLLNKINAFINYNSNKTYFIEYFFMSIDILLKEINTKVKIEINKNQYDLNNYDNFQSENRKRINVLNVPFQEIENFSENKLENINSIQICKIFNQNKNVIFGIFNINEMDSKDEKCDNSYFDKYYPEFGDVTSLFEDINLDTSELFTICKNKYDISKIDKSDDRITSTFNTGITLSQYKTRLGLLLCHYFKLYNMDDVRLYYQFINSNIRIADLTLMQSLRVIIFYMDKKLNNSKSLNDVIIFSRLSKNTPNSPYVIANEFNKQEIKELKESSRYFTAYLQLDSFILKNYYINESSFSFSLELLFIMKYFLLSNYEDIIFTTNELSELYAYMSESHGITVINENNLFTKDINIKRIGNLNDIKKSKNFALPISMEFRHEKNSHKKRRRKNPRVFSPFVYYKDGKLERIIVKKKINENEFIEKGESGKMVEKYLSEDNTVITCLKNIPIFGELLKSDYFVDKNFVEFSKKFVEIKQKNKELFKDEKGSFNELYDTKDIKLKKEEVSQIYDKNLEEEGSICIGDVQYSKKILAKYLQNWEIKNTFKKK